MTLDAASIDRLGWDAGWAAAFEPYAGEGHRPARVVAVHRETSVVRDAGGDRPAAGGKAHGQVLHRNHKKASWTYR